MTTFRVVSAVVAVVIVALVFTQISPGAAVVVAAWFVLCGAVGNRLQRRA